MAIKKSDLYSSIWQSCDELRGGMDASQYKDYVLFMLFIKYISDKYADSSDFEPPIVIPPGSSFSAMLELRGTSDIGDKINTQVIAPLVAANNGLGHDDFPDFNDPNKLGQGDEMVQRLSNLINIFADPQLDFSQNRVDQDDILGDAYEYLIRHFATQSGKSKGQFYTPAEVSRVIAKVIGISSQNASARTTAYDPTCGSGSLLLKVAAQSEKEITLEGQEKDVTTAGLARMNMILHGFPGAKIVTGNTLTNPKFRDGPNLRTYDYVVANPPFSDKTWTTGLSPSKDDFQRFEWGQPPPKQGDYAYLQHIIRSMKGASKAACVLPHGVLFRGNAESTIRKRLVESGYLKGIIGLPPNLFYGTGIPACIVVLDKENAVDRTGVFMIDASKGFRKDGAKNRLRDQDIHRIVDTFTRLLDVPRYARMVSFEEIRSEKNDFNLNLPRYIHSSDDEDIQDLEGHLKGGIPERDVDLLEAYWRAFPNLRSFLFESAGRSRYVQLSVGLKEFQSAIIDHSDFSNFTRTVNEHFSDWRNRVEPLLLEFKENSDPKELIEAISEILLTVFDTVPLTDAYVIYQNLMDLWAEFMQDDAYLISSLGWVRAAQPREIIQVKSKGGKLKWPEQHDYLKENRRFKSDLLPAQILVDRFFGCEFSVIRNHDRRIDALGQKLDEMKEEHSGVDGLLFEVTNDKQNISATSVKVRMRVIGTNPLYTDERKVLEDYQEVLEEQSIVKKQRKKCQHDLDIKTDFKYANLLESEIKHLVIYDKWFSKMAACVHVEVESVSRTLTERIRQLAERYETPLPDLTSDVEAHATRVQRHLSKMGVSWN